MSCGGTQWTPPGSATKLTGPATAQAGAPRVRLPRRANWAAALPVLSAGLGPGGNGPLATGMLVLGRSRATARELRGPVWWHPDGVPTGGVDRDERRLNCAGLDGKLSGRWRGECGG